MRQRTELRPYQRRAVKFLNKRRYAALFIDMGLGKTIIALTAIIDMLRRGEIDGVLIVAPIRVVYGVWRQEARQWQHTRRLKFSIVHGTERERIEALEKPAHVHLINPEGLAWLRRYYGRKQWPWKALFVDESSMFKRPRVKRFMALRGVLRFFRHRVIMTGTPTPNGLIDLWTQFFIVDMGYALGSTFTDYKANYFRRTGYMGFQFQANAGAQQAITESIGPRVVALNSEDYIELPPFIDDPVWVELPDDAMALYRRLESEMFLEFEEGGVDVQNAAGLSNRTSQIAGGALWLKDDFGNKTWRPIHDAKLLALRELVDELQGEPPIIVYRFAHELERIKAMFPKYTVLGKGTTAKATTRIEAMWNRGRLPGLIVHPRSAGHGLNLQHGGHHLIWYSPTWSLEQYLQVCKRLYRSGQAYAVINHLILAASTTDLAIMAAIRAKDEGQQSVKAALSEYYNLNRGRYGNSRAIQIEEAQPGRIANIFQNLRPRV